MWDYQLGGKDNFAADRQAAEQVNEACRQAGVPDGRTVARESRAFLRQAVRYLAGEAGIDQFIDIGAGLPTQGNVHEVAQAVNPQATVVYVDYDPMVLTWGRALLATNPHTTVITADLRRPDTILTNPDLHELVDLTRPVAVLLVSVLHLLPDGDNPTSIAAAVWEALPPGSYLALSHFTDQAYPEVAATIRGIFTELQVSTPLIPRSREAIAGFFTGLELVLPGLVHPHEWRPDPAMANTKPSQWMYVGVGRKPARREARADKGPGDNALGPPVSADATGDHTGRDAHTKAGASPRRPRGEDSLWARDVPRSF
jgi:hypothetical protein